MRESLRIAITGLGSHSGQSVLSSLRHSLPEAWVLGLDAATDVAGLYQCDAHAKVPLVSAGAAYLESVAELLHRYEINVLIPGLDVELPIVAAQHAALAAVGRTIVVCSSEVISLCRSKLACARALRSHGLPFVETWPLVEVLEGRNDPTFPCIVKPDRGSGSRGIHIVAQGEPWPDLLNLDDYIVQPLLVGADETAGTVPVSQRAREELSIQGVVGADGTIAGIFLGRTHKDRGISLLHAPLLRPEVEAPARAILELLAGMGLRGPCNIQGRWTHQGPVFFEVNPRFTGGTAARTQLGFEEVWATIALLHWGEPVANVAPRLRTRKDLVCLKHMTETLVPLAAMA